MLGPVGPVLKRVLENRGFEITRPTQHERQLCRSPIATWFANDMDRLARVYRSNREMLARVPDWTDSSALNNSLWRYGVPEAWERGEYQTGSTRLNETEREITYTDLIAFLASEMEGLRYLEIGVSVGKNFAQVRASAEGTYTALDVEYPNPPLIRAIGIDLASEQLGAMQSVETLAGTNRTIPLTRYAGGNVTYIQGDQFASATWEAMRGNRFNFIFSDGVHSPRALRSELDFLIEADLIDFQAHKFVMYWDDMVDDPMQSAFMDCANKLERRFGGGTFGLHWIHGTYGAKRLNGIFEFRR